MKNSSKILLCILLVLAIFITGCTRADEKVSEKTQEKGKQSSEELVIKLEGGDWGYSTPFMHYRRGPGAYKMALVFDGLLEKDEEGLIPWLAKSWEVENNGLDYIFQLNEDIKWQDGKDMTSEDVKFTFDYYQEHPPVWNELMNNGENIVEKVDVLDEQTVRIKVNEANATYLERLGTMKIIPKHIWMNVKDPVKFDSEEAVIGCGPYELVDYNKEQGTYRFKAFKDYWGPKQKVDVIEFVPVSDSVLAFEKGDIDMFIASPDILGRYENSDSFKVSKNKPFWGYRLIMNMEKREELKDKDLRKALAYGINRKEMVEKVGRGAGIIANIGYLPDAHKWYNPNTKNYTFDLEKAEELIKGKEYGFDLLVSNSPKEIKMAELMKLSLEKIGIQVNVKSVEKKTRDGMVKDHDFELAIIGHGGWGSDADRLRDTYYAFKSQDSHSRDSNSLPGFYNEEINHLALKQMKELDAKKRKDLIYSLQEKIAEEVPQLPLYNTISYYIYKPSKYDGWMYTYDHHSLEHCKLSYLEKE
jgi:peptide/nickel transport system substrate-binding protein